MFHMQHNSSVLQHSLSYKEFSKHFFPDIYDIIKYIPVYNHSRSNSEEGGQAFLSIYENISTERRTAIIINLNFNMKEKKGPDIRIR